MYHEVFGWVVEFGKGRTYIDFDKFSSAFAHLHIVCTAHVFHNVFCEVVASDTNALVAHDTTKRNHCDFSGTTTYINNHVAFRSKHIKTNTKGGSHWLVNHIYLTAASVLA